MMTVRLNHYSQVQFETNRYSVPVNHARRTVTLKIYPFHVEIWGDREMLTRHERCYGREQDIFDPLHYLPLLLEKPGALDFAKPIRRWKEVWPPSYHELLSRLRETWPDGRGVRDFIRICAFHQDFAAHLVERAIEQALSYGCAHFDGVSSCLRQVCEEEAQQESLSDEMHGSSTVVSEALSYPVDLSRYEQLLKLSW